MGKTESLVRSGRLQSQRNCQPHRAPLKAWLAVDVRGLACGGSGSSCRRGHARVRRRCFPGLRAWVNSWDRPGLVLLVCPTLSFGAQVARAHRCVPCLRPWCGRRRGTWSQAGWARQQRPPGSSVVLERPGRYGCSAGTSGALTQTRCLRLPATATYFRAGPACARQPGVVKDTVNEELRSGTTRLARSSHSCCPLDEVEACAREGGFLCNEDFTSGTLLD